MQESLIVDTWLYETLSADSALVAIVGDRFYGSDIAQESTAYPFVQWVFQTAVDVMEQAQFRIMTNCLFIVKGVCKESSYESLSPVADRLEALLHRQAGGVTGGWVLSCTREEEFRFAENDNGVPYRHLGGVFRLLVQRS